MSDLFENLLIGVAVLVMGFFAFMFLAAIVYLPATLVAEKDCLALGYPKSSVAYDFSAYCMNLEGVVTVKVQEVGK